MKLPLVSVLMPAYNHEKFIGETIESVLNQTLKNIELIIINDGSTDNTDKVIKKFNDSRIKYIFQENKDAPFTINKAISMAKGKYISIINSDDVYHEDRLSLIYNLARENNSKFIFTDVEFIDDNSNIIDDKSHWYIKRADEMKELLKNTGSFSTTFLSGNLTITTSTFFFESGLVKEIGAFSTHIKYSHDHEFILRTCLSYEDKIFYLDQKLLKYRLHIQNTFKKSPIDSRAGQYSVIAGMLPQFIKNTEDRKVVQSMVDRLEMIHGLWIRDYVFIRNTITWKITKPLRWFLSILSRN
ncbi:MAG: glycosyltransferase [Thermodesulfobacteriota bacterium]